MRLETKRWFPPWSLPKYMPTYLRAVVGAGVEEDQVASGQLVVDGHLTAGVGDRDHIRGRFEHLVGPARYRGAAVGRERQRELRAVVEHQVPEAGAVEAAQLEWLRGVCGAAVGPGDAEVIVEVGALLPGAVVQQRPVVGGVRDPETRSIVDGGGSLDILRS